MNRIDFSIMTGLLRVGLTAIVLSSIAGCSMFGAFSGNRHLSERECLARVMYFESNRSSAEGMLAVGTVVMNRVDDARYPATICEVVGQKNQFAAGVLSRPMTSNGAKLALATAGKIMAGTRHAGVRQAQHFHTAGLRFPYNNMHYVLMAGGNEFYEKY